MRKTTAALVTAATAVLATGVGLGTASASLTPAARSGIEHFSLMTTSATSNSYSLIATGVFTAGGVDIAGSPTTDTARLPGGTFKIHHPGHSGAPKVNWATCLFTFTSTSKITVNGGTGKYKGITGSGKAVLSIVGILARSHGHCSVNANPVAWQQTIDATTKVHL